MGIPWEECLLTPATSTCAPSSLPHRRFLLSSYTGVPGGRPLQAWLDVGREAHAGCFWLRVRCAALRGTRGPGPASWEGPVLQQASCGPGDAAAMHHDASHSHAALAGEGDATTLSVPYDVDRGDSVLTALRDLHAVMRTQLLVARVTAVLEQGMHTVHSHGAYRHTIHTGLPPGGDAVAIAHVGPWDAVLQVGDGLLVRVGWQATAAQGAGRAALMQQAGVSCVLSSASAAVVPSSVCAQWARLVDGCQERVLVEALSLCARGMAAVEGAVAGAPCARWLSGAGLFSARVLWRRADKV